MGCWAVAKILYALGNPVGRYWSSFHSSCSLGCEVVFEGLEFEGIGFRTSDYQKLL